MKKKKQKDLKLKKEEKNKKGSRSKTSNIGNKVRITIEINRSWKDEDRNNIDKF